MADQTDTTATETSTATTDTGGASEAGATSSPAAVDTSAEATDTTVLGSATTETGTGDPAGKGGPEEPASPTPTPVPDDAGVPEAYKLEPIKIGEGDTASTIEIDSALLETVSPGLKEAGITQAQLDKIAPLVPAIQEASLKQMNDEFAATRANWAKEAQADAEIGGKNWTETQLLAARALDTFGAKSEIKDGVETNEFRKLLNESGLGNHPVMLRMFRNIGAATSEDGTFTRNTTVTEAKLPREARNYPNDVPKQS